MRVGRHTPARLLRVGIGLVADNDRSTSLSSTTLTVSAHFGTGGVGVVPSCR